MTPYEKIGSSLFAGLMVTQCSSEIQDIPIFLRCERLNTCRMAMAKFQNLQLYAAQVVLILRFA